MIRAYSQRLTPPFSGQVQIAESDRARAVTLDGNAWEIHFMHAAPGGQVPGYLRHKRTYSRVANIRHSALREISTARKHDGQPLDERLLELAAFLADAELPFPATDQYEYWLLDSRDESPLALIFTCVEAESMETFPTHLEWKALPAAVMPVDRTDEELKNGTPPVNSRFEGFVTERAGWRPKARWIQRGSSESEMCPTLLVRQDWDDDEARQLYQRYIERQSPRLLMLPGLSHEQRLTLEQAASGYATEVARFFPMYPEVADPELMSKIRVEARMRSVTEDKPPIHNRRDGILYI